MAAGARIKNGGACAVLNMKQASGTLSTLALQLNHSDDGGAESKPL